MGSHFAAVLLRVLSDTTSHACQGSGDVALTWRCTGWKLIAADLAIAGIHLACRCLKRADAQGFSKRRSLVQEDLHTRLKAAGATCNTSVQHVTCNMSVRVHRHCSPLALCFSPDPEARDTEARDPQDADAATAYELPAQVVYPSELDGQPRRVRLFVKKDLFIILMRCFLFEISSSFYFAYGGVRSKFFFFLPTKRPNDPR